MLHNLLPKEEKRRLKREYLIRLASIFVFLCAGSVTVGAISLVPSYIHVSSALSEIPQDDTINVSEADRPVAVLARTAGLLQDLRDKAVAEPMTDLMLPLLAARPDGIRITGVTFDRSNLSFSLRGVASTRDALVAYKKAIENLPRVSSVASPIENLAKSTNLEFTLSAELAPVAIK